MSENPLHRVTIVFQAVDRLSRNLLGWGKQLNKLETEALAVNKAVGNLGKLTTNLESRMLNTRAVSSRKQVALEQQKLRTLERLNVAHQSSMNRITREGERTAKALEVDKTRRLAASNAKYEALRAAAQAKYNPTITRTTRSLSALDRRETTLIRQGQIEDYTGMPDRLRGRSYQDILDEQSDLSAKRDTILARRDDILARHAGKTDPTSVATQREELALNQAQVATFDKQIKENATALKSSAALNQIESERAVLLKEQQEATTAMAAEEKKIDARLAQSLDLTGKNADARIAEAAAANELLVTETKTAQAAEAAKAELNITAEMDANTAAVARYEDAVMELGTMQHNIALGMKYDYEQVALAMDKVALAARGNMDLTAAAAAERGAAEARGMPAQLAKDAKHAAFGEAMHGVMTGGLLLGGSLFGADMLAHAVSPLMAAASSLQISKMHLRAVLPNKANYNQVVSQINKGVQAFPYTTFQELASNYLLLRRNIPELANNITPSGMKQLMQFQKFSTTMGTAYGYAPSQTAQLFRAIEMSVPTSPGGVPAANMGDIVTRRMQLVFKAAEHFGGHLPISELSSLFTRGSGALFGVTDSGLLSLLAALSVTKGSSLASGLTQGMNHLFTQKMSPIAMTDLVKLGLITKHEQLTLSRGTAIPSIMQLMKVGAVKGSKEFTQDPIKWIHDVWYNAVRKAHPKATPAQMQEYLTAYGKNVFGSVRAANAFMAVIGHFAQIIRETHMEQMDDSLDKFFARFSKKYPMTVLAFHSALKRLDNTLGKQLTPSVINAITQITHQVNNLNTYLKAHPKISSQWFNGIVNLLEVTAVAGVIMIVKHALSGLVEVILKYGVFRLLPKIGYAFGVITRLVIAGLELINPEILAIGVIFVGLAEILGDFSRVAEAVSRHITPLVSTILQLLGLPGIAPRPKEIALASLGGGSALDKAAAGLHVGTKATSTDVLGYGVGSSPAFGNSPYVSHGMMVNTLNLMISGSGHDPKALAATFKQAILDLQRSAQTNGASTGNTRIAHGRAATGGVVR